MPAPTRHRVAWLGRIAGVTALVGIGAGIGGALVSLALALLGRLAYGLDGSGFLAAVEGTDPLRRVVVLAVAGVLGGVGWWALRRWARPVVSIDEAVAGRRMPTLSTLGDVLLQVITVGLGASIGREQAPRELGALIAERLTSLTGLTGAERRVLVACGAGAGLAAVYDVPLGGALFTIEVLLARLRLATAVPAFATAAIATIVARVAVPDAPLYSFAPASISPSLLVWALIAGPVLGVLAAGFTRLIALATRHRPTGRRVLVVMPAAFILVGLVAVPLPAVLGNGQSIAQLSFTGATPLLLLALLGVVKALTTSATIGSGAAGGTLTPSLAIGGAIGAALGGAWSLAWPGSPVGAFAVVAAAAFLAATMRAPFTALVLVVEFTGQGPALLIPTMLAVAGSVGIGRLLAGRRVAGAD